MLSVMRYRVERTVEGEYPYDELYAAHHWADLASSDFQPGVRHRLSLTHETPAGANWTPAWDTSPMGVLFCLSYEVLT